MPVRPGDQRRIGALDPPACGERKKREAAEETGGGGAEVIDKPTMLLSE